MPVYENEYTKEIRFPLGGIGTGCVWINGSGEFVDWELLNRPAKNTFNGGTHFMIRAIRNGVVEDVRMVAGPYRGPRNGDPYNYGFGVPMETLAGVPRFRNAKFKGEFPIAELELSDPAFPGKVVLTAFNPLIPLNEYDSSLPGAMFRIRVENSGDSELTYTVVLVADNLWEPVCLNEPLTGFYRGVVMRPGEEALKEAPRGEFAIATDAENVSLQVNMEAHDFFDGLSLYFERLHAAAPIPHRDGTGLTRRFREKSVPGGVLDLRCHALVAAERKVPAGAETEFRFVFAWRVPENRNSWISDRPFVNLHAARFASAESAASYMLSGFGRLFEETDRFRRAFYDSTLPPEFIDAAGAAMSVLKTTTVLRAPDGTPFCYEGSGVDRGSCTGSCNHVFSYEYTLAYLFPELERAMRTVEFERNVRSSGEMPMRICFPRFSRSRGAADGQFGCIIRAYREWKLSGDDAWLHRHYPAIRKALEYAWSPENRDLWDPEQSGILTGRQHNTLDVDLFGPNGWLSGMYLAALRAGTELAEAVGDTASAALWKRIADRGTACLNSELFDGTNFIQKLNYHSHEALDGLPQNAGLCEIDNPTTLDEFYWDSARREIRYQLVHGTMISQLQGQWHASLLGLPRVFDEEKSKTALETIFRRNFVPDFGDRFNACRLFALAGEGGTMICSQSESPEVPHAPLPYADETMPGFEYAFAAELIQHGKWELARRIVKAVRDRHNGSNRNPWNECECGSSYIRSMAAHSLLLAASGFRCDLSAGRLEFAPAVPGDFRCFWSCGAAWGVFSRSANESLLEVLGGTLNLREMKIDELAHPVNRILRAGERVRFA